jgi:serine/threonine protein kinase
VFSFENSQIYEIIFCLKGLNCPLFLSLGSLDKVLFDSRQKLSEEQKLRFVRGIAAGMLHLHKHNIVHRDLAARNILLTTSGDPKISVHIYSIFTDSIAQQD